MNPSKFVGSKSLLDLSTILDLSRRHTNTIRRYEQLSQAAQERYEKLMTTVGATAEQCERMHRLRWKLLKRRQRILDAIVAEQNAWIEGDTLMRTMIEKEQHTPFGYEEPIQPRKNDPMVERLLQDDSLERMLDARWPRNKSPGVVKPKREDRPCAAL